MHREWYERRVVSREMFESDRRLLHHAGESLGRREGERTMIGNFRQAIAEFIDDDCPTLAAALAYYTIFSLPPLVFIIIVVAGFVVGREAVQAAIQQQVQAMLGGAASGQVSTMATTAGQTSAGGILGLTVSVAGVIFGATSGFAQLQAALNRSWKIRVETGGIRGFIAKRILSFLIVILMAGLILASVISTHGRRP